MDQAEPSAMRRASGFSQLEGTIQTMGCFAVTAIVAAILVPNLLHARIRGQWDSCISNLKNISIALQMYGQDNKGGYPPRLGQLAPEYLKSIPTCPAAEADTYSSSYRVSYHPNSYSYACSGQHHHSDSGGPRFDAQTGLEAGPPPNRGKSTTFMDGAVAVVTSLLAGGFFLIQAFCPRPEPPPQSQPLLKYSKTLAWLNWISWPLLCFILSVWLGWTLPLESGLGRFALGSFLGPLLAQILVMLGGFLWHILSPAPPAEALASPRPGQSPQLDSPNLAEVLLPPWQRRQAHWLSLSFPLLTITLFTILPSLGADPEAALRGSLYGLAAAALLAFPAYLWGRHWSRELFRQRLEWIPGTGELLLHANRWGRPGVYPVGTQGDVQSVEAVTPGTYRVQVGELEFLLADGPFLKNLQGCLPPREP